MIAHMVYNVMEMPPTNWKSKLKSIHTNSTIFLDDPTPQHTFGYLAQSNKYNGKRNARKKERETEKKKKQGANKSKRHPSASVSNSAVDFNFNLVVFWRNFKHMLSEMSNQSNVSKLMLRIFFYLLKLIHWIQGILLLCFQKITEWMDKSNKKRKCLFYFLLSWKRWCSGPPFIKFVIQSQKKNEMVIAEEFSEKKCISHSQCFSNKYYCLTHLFLPMANHRWPTLQHEYIQHVWG